MAKRARVFLTALSILSLPTLSALPQVKNLPKGIGDSRGSPQNQLSNAEMGLMNINNVSAWIQRNGESGNNPISGWSGIVYPRGTASIVFQDGIVWGGFVDDTRDTSLVRWRVGGQTYQAGTVPGWIVTPGDSANPPVAVDPNHPRARIYKIRSDWQTLIPGDPDIIMEAAEFNNVSPTQVTQQMAQGIIDRYALDWSEWPGDLGAPFYDNNSNGVWDPGVDEPGLQKADQVLWFVINDVDSAVTHTLYGSPPIGLEVQVTLWGYKADGVFGETLYRRHRIINKSGLFIDSMYVCQWSDPDLGMFGDDYVGSDTVLQAAFVYNSSPVDNEYSRFGLLPAAAAYGLLQGPIIHTGNPQDTAMFDFRRVAGARNHPMTAQFYYATSGLPDPPFSYEGALQWYNLFKGLTPIDGTPFTHPAVPGPTTFWLDGDPIGGSGRLDGIIEGPGDRRLGMCTGFFTMANGDTQEVVFALVGGTRHIGNHLTSLAELKQNLAAIRGFYGREFDVPDVTWVNTHPTDSATQLYVRANIGGQTGVISSEIGFAPEVGSESGFTVQLFDDGIHNDSLAGDGIWGNSVTRTNHKYPVKGDLVVQTAGSSFTFPGLFGNVAVRPLPVFQNLRVVWENGRQDTSLNHRETVHLAFDIMNPDGLNAIDSMRITNLAPRTSGQVINFTNSIPPRGIVSNSALFFIVNGPDSGTAMSVPCRVRSDFSLATFETSVPVTPWDPGTHWGDTLEVTSLRGVVHNVKPVIADASQLNGNTYLITFFQGTTDLRWRLFDQTLAQIKHDNGAITTSPDYPHPVIDGVQWRVMDGTVSPGVVDFLAVANAAGPLVPPEGAAASFAGFPVIADPTERQQVGPAEWLINTGASVFGGSYQYFIPRVFRNDNFSRFLGYDFEIRFTAAGGRAYMAFTSGLRIDVPFELWNAGRGTPADPSDDFRMIPLILDNDGNDVFNLVNVDHPVSPDADDPQTDWVYWYEPTDRSPGSNGYNAWVAAPDPGHEAFIGDEVIARIVFVNWNGGTVPGPYNQDMAEPGTVFRIISKKPNFAGDSLQIIATPLSVPIGDVPQSIYLDQNYPNPFNPVTTIRFGLTRRTRVELRVFNILGQEVRKLANAEMEAGNHEMRWDARNDFGRSVASGVYFYQLRSGEFIQTKKMLLLR